jgi:hypothetical protein
MRSSTIVLATGLLAAPLSLLAGQDNTPAPVVPAADLSVTQTAVNGHVLTPAPMPAIGPSQGSRVDRMGGPDGQAMTAGPVNATPFSAAPAAPLTNAGAQTSPADRTAPPADGTGVTPSLGK